MTTPATFAPCPRNTPWGPAQHIDHIGDGIYSVETAGHGGYWVPPALRSKIPAPCRDTHAGLGWYEEDCDWAIVAVVFPHLFPGRELSDGSFYDTVDAARNNVAYWQSAEKCAALGIVPDPNNFTIKRAAAGGR